MIGDTKPNVTFYVSAHALVAAADVSHILPRHQMVQQDGVQGLHFQES
jgi:hypothetical protein